MHPIVTATCAPLPRSLGPRGLPHYFPCARLPLTSVRDTVARSSAKRRRGACPSASPTATPEAAVLEVAGAGAVLDVAAGAGAPVPTLRLDVPACESALRRPMWQTLPLSEVAMVEPPTERATGRVSAFGRLESNSGVGNSTLSAAAACWASVESVGRVLRKSTNLAAA